MVAPRIPYTTPFPPPPTIPRSASTLPGAIKALTSFLLTHRPVVLLTGAGISVASGLADYRGENGTYRLRRDYKPIFFAEFVGHHKSRQRYWARSFLGWPAMRRARQNVAHWAAASVWHVGRGMGLPGVGGGGGDRGKMDADSGLVVGVVTQNVDSLHHLPSPAQSPPITELHGTLATLTCLTCRRTTPREEFQHTLARLNPLWAVELARLSTITSDGDPVSGNTNNNNNSKDKDINFRKNPDGDYELPSAPFHTFRYPPCPHCLASHPDRVRVDGDGAHLPSPSGEPAVGVLKPSVTFFGESVDAAARDTAERWVDEARGVVVLGSSLATYSAWRLVRAVDAAGKGVAVVNLGGVRGDDTFFGAGDEGGRKVRVEYTAQEMLVGVLRELGQNVEDLEKMMVMGAGKGK